MTAPTPPRPLSAAAAPARPLQIRTVPRGAVEALVARLNAQGFQHVA